MGTKKSWEYITKTATTTTVSWTNQQIAEFNYFNPNGLYTKWNEMCNTLVQYVNEGVIPSGWLMAYGSLSDYNPQRLREITMGDGRVKGIELGVVLEMVENDIEKGYNKLAEFILGE